MHIVLIRFLNIYTDPAGQGHRLHKARRRRRPITWPGSAPPSLGEDEDREARPDKDVTVSLSAVELPQFSAFGFIEVRSFNYPASYYMTIGESLLDYDPNTMEGGTKQVLNTPEVCGKPYWRNQINFQYLFFFKKNYLHFVHRFPCKKKVGLHFFQIS